MPVSPAAREGASRSDDAEMEGGQSKPMDETDSRPVYSKDKSKNESTVAQAGCWTGLTTVNNTYRFADLTCPTL
jgi:hypothetical protein